ncbi:MAG: UpxY family transcription antiterminator, partial [Saprospiraceae bacterium]
MASATQKKEKDFENHLHVEESRWFAVYTKYKREKLVQKMLQRKGIETYLPLQKVTRKYVRKVKHLELPLINCHLFVKIVQAEYIPVLETENVIKFVQIARNLISIPQREMDIMQRVVGEEYAVTIEPLGLVVGDEVEIIAGSLTGVKGKLVSTPERKVVVIELESTGFQLRMDVP